MDRELFDAYLHDRSRLGPAEDGAFTGAAGGAACGDLSRFRSRSRMVRSCGSASTPRAVVRLGRRPPRLRRWSRAPLYSTSPGLAIDEVDEALGGLTPAKRHAAQLAADALHRALAQAAASDQTLARAPRGEQRPTAGGDPERVLVAMSGGVDSAVAALLEQERGAEVVGVTLKLWADPETDGAKACCSPEAVLGARSLAHSLGIPHLTLDLEEEFRRRVVAEFISGYAEGSTPNPCIACNGEVRIAAMVDLAGRLGADLPRHRPLRAHRRGRRGPAARRRFRRQQGPELHARRPAARLLRRVRFPLTELTKPEVREIAARHDLAVAKKPESQDLCFLSGQGKGGLPAPPRRPARARGRPARSLRQGDRPPPRSPQLHRRPAARHRRRRRGAALRPRHRRRRQHGHGRPAARPDGAHGPASQRRSAPRPEAASTRSACATARSPSRPRSRSAMPAPTRSSRSPWARTLPVSRRARPPCCWPARRSSATAPSPRRPDGARRP